jgi:hypothetical protein
MTPCQFENIVNKQRKYQNYEEQENSKEDTVLNKHAAVVR